MFEIWIDGPYKKAICIYRAEERIIKTSSTNTGSRAYLKYTGEIYWPPIKRYTSSCNIDITYFPFDDQICHLKLGSWAYDGDQVNVWNPMNEMDMSQALKNSEFEVVDSKIRRFITYYRCCVEPFPDIKVYIHIRRQTIQHVFNIVIPCITLSIICMVGFLIPPDKNDEKISVQLTVLFSLSLFMLLVAESTPRTSETVPLISIYLTALMCITAMSTTAHVVADKLVASPRIRKEVPYLVNKLIYKLSLCCNDQKKKAENIELRNLTSNGSTPATTEVKQQQNGGITEITDDDKSPSAPVSKSQTKTKSSPEKKSSNVKSKQQTKTKESAEPAMGNTEKGLQDLFFHLKQRHDKVRLDLQDTAKWYKVATKMDRIFFWSYGFSVTILTFYAFVFKPMQKDISLYENI
ncbi:hypothetical protein EB796_008474 [Bugula neritina]|uniref:Uncharacterized protein n=1 Tax=Bugula neritina TaxID=10212 RepID=A0A7J7K3L4_BUGNE|nr:hypothetical protein EB796_008474 [Bugula neritina]